MSLEIALRRFTLLPGFIQTGNGEPRKAHYLGKNETTPLEPKQDQGRKNDNAPKKPSPSKYRDLADITLGEVEDVYNHFKSQLILSPAEGWIAKNYFCQLPLKRKGEDRPPLVFGRIKTCYPSDGHVNNIEELEMYFPRRDAAPDVLHVRLDDIAVQKPTYSYCVGVKFYASEEEIADFSHSENIFIEKGFAPIYETSYLDLLDVNEQNRSALPWLYVMGSGWFASIPNSMQPEIREQLRSLVRWNKVIFNYHPKRYSLQYRSLNEELDFNYGFSEHFLLSPQDTDQTLRKVDESFGQMFMQGME
ncbi:MAG TPA: hypothetical protein VF896_00125 [Anaerolineales bacterium]